MNKKIKQGVVLIAILVLPSSIYIALSTGKHNFANIPIVGERRAVERVDKMGEPFVDTLYHTIPPFSFVDQNGEVFTNEDLDGKVYVADFFFTSCPRICPSMQYSMKRLQETFKGMNDFELVSFTVNPSTDSPEVLKAYAEELGADLTNWHFLTGEAEDIYELGRKGYFLNAMEDSSAAGGFLHSQYFILVDKEGRIRSGKDDYDNLRVVYDGTSDYEMNELIDDIKILIANYKLALKKNNE